jgi:hypothetical protein
MSFFSRSVAGSFSSDFHSSSAVWPLARFSAKPAPSKAAAMTASLSGNFMGEYSYFSRSESLFHGVMAASDRGCVSVRPIRARPADFVEDAVVDHLSVGELHWLVHALFQQFQ